VTDSCITPGLVAGAICRHPNSYLFWDFIHPTTQTHGC
jgi:phospholipase/lecithinase/hemolysin